MSGLDQARFREVLGHFATGVTIVTALEEGVPVGFTCQSFAALSLDPPMVILAPARSSTSWPRIAQAGAFCVNILEEHQEALARAFAVSGGDKFDGVGWSQGVVTGSPVIIGSLAVVECQLGDIFDGGDHELVTGHVVAIDVGEGNPLLFYRSGFGRFAP
jgi:3-hydroxy-9,10-secoandrosta-1,3,5(10)-triene-9,17-dione monooxygenase reductase component